MSALATLAAARAARVELQAVDDDLRLRADAEPPGALLGAIRAHKVSILELLRGDRCRYCEGPVSYAEHARPAVAFADQSGAHLDCYDRAEEARLLRAAERVVAGVTSTSIHGELLRGDEP